MRRTSWIASLFALSLMMALFHRVAAGGPLEARATLALGFLLLAAYRLESLTLFDLFPQSGHLGSVAQLVR